jgi:hypothetical protein
VDQAQRIHQRAKRKKKSSPHFFDGGSVPAGLDPPYDSTLIFGFTQDDTKIQWDKIVNMNSVAFPSRAEQKESFEANKLEKRLCKLTAQAIVDYAMIENGDKVMVCLSGGKDSYTLLEILLLLRERAPIKFDIVAFNLDQKQPNFPEHVLPDYLTQRGVEFLIGHQDTYSTVKRVIPEGKTTCGLCSRLRRGVIYRARPSSRRHSRNAVPQHVLRQQTQSHGAETIERQRPTHRHPPPRLLQRKRPRRIRGTQSLPHHSL